MTKPRRTFSAEFKREAADLVLKQNYSFIEASRSLCIGETALRRWVDQLQQERTGVTPHSKALTPEQQKTQELEVLWSSHALHPHQFEFWWCGGTCHPSQQPCAGDTE